MCQNLQRGYIISELTLTHLIYRTYIYISVPFYRENGSSEDGAEFSKADKRDANGDLKRKQSEVHSEQQYPNKSPKNVQAGKQASPSDHKSSHKQAKREKLDWSVLRPPKFPNKNSEQN